MNKIRYEEQWLHERLNLFNTFTVPSLLSQTNQKFRWVGIVHKDSPQWFINELKQIKRMEIALVEWDIEAKITGHTTVNVDTDDAITRDFIDKAHGVNFEGESLFLRGMRYRHFTDCWIATRSLNSHFNIVQHPNMTVLDFSHGMGKLKKNIVDIKHPMWLEVIHEQNISNRIKTAKKDKNLGRKHALQYFDIKEYEDIHGR
jgi:hypothetical protein